MKLIAKPIEMIASFAQNGTIHPLRFRVLNENQAWDIIKVNQVISVDHERKAGNPVIIYKCQSDIKGVCKIYELKYERNTYLWTLYKI